jgi:hypothetical protein
MRILTILIVAAAIPPWRFPAPAREIEIVARDNAFRAPRTVAAGRAAFRLVNQDSVLHELNLSLLKPNVSVADFQSALRTGKEDSVEKFIDRPVGTIHAIGRKRSTATLSTRLIAGRTYAIICATRAGDGKRHTDTGMHAVFVVAAEPPTDAPPPDRVDTIVGNEFAYTRYARTMSPGRHEFAFVNQGKLEHEVVLIALKPGVTLKQVVDADKAGGNPRALMEETIGVLWTKGRMSAIGTMEVDLKPGREYLILCTFPADQKPLTHRHLGMFGAIQVTGAR